MKIDIEKIEREYCGELLRSTKIAPMPKVEPLRQEEDLESAIIYMAEELENSGFCPDETEGCKDIHRKCVNCIVEHFKNKHNGGENE